MRPDKTRPVGARARISESLDSVERAVGTDHSLYAGVLNNLGVIQEGRNNLAEACLAYRRVLEIDRRRLPEGHPDLVISLGNLAGTLRRLNELEEAEELYQEVLLALRQKHQQPHQQPHQQTDQFQVKLGTVLTGRRMFDQAELHLTAAKSAIEKRAGQDSDECRSVQLALVRLEHLRQSDREQ